MAINVMKAKKWGALLVCCMASSVSMFIGTVYYGIWGAVLFLLGGALISVLLGNIMLKNPFTAMLEGQGILVFDINSTGILQPFIVRVNPPYIEGKLGKADVSGVFDRNTVYQMAAPKVNKAGADPIVEGEKVGGIRIELDEGEYNSGRFALFHYPVLLYNSQLKSIVSKDMLGESEKTVFAEYGILYLNRKIEELTSVTRDFARYIVENLKPDQSIWKSKWVWIIIVVAVIIIIAIFAGPVLKTIASQSGGIAETFNFGGGGAVTPKG